MSAVTLAAFNLIAEQLSLRMYTVPISRFSFAEEKYFLVFFKSIGPKCSFPKCSFVKRTPLCEFIFLFQRQKILKCGRKHGFHFSSYKWQIPCLLSLLAVCSPPIWSCRRNLRSLFFFKHLLKKLLTTYSLRSLFSSPTLKYLDIIL